MDEKFLKTKEVANLYRISTRTLMRMVNEGRIPVLRISPKVLRFPTWIMDTDSPQYKQWKASQEGSKASHLLDVSLDQWAAEARQRRPIVLTAAMEALQKLAKGKIGYGPFNEYPNIRAVTYKGIKWGIEARPLLDTPERFWILCLWKFDPDLVEVHRTPCDPEDCMTHHAGYLWNIIKKGKST